MNDSRDIGEMGELHFNTWCAEVGLVANKATKDKMGWDFIVEFPFSNEISDSHVHQSASKCKVQVKATDGQKRKLQVSLANLRKLAVDPYPCFYIFIEYDGNNLPSNAFLRHVDDELIGNILETVATTENQSFTVHYDESHLLKSLSGEALSNKIKSYIGNDIWAYVERKKNYLENAGYVDGEMAFNFNVVGEKSLNDLIDLSIGLKTSTEISNITATRKRFGQDTVLPKLSADTAELSMPGLKPSTRAKLIFRKGSIFNDYRFDVDIYVPSFLNDFDHPKFKARFVASFFEMTWDKSLNKIDIKIDFGHRQYTLVEYRQAFNFLAALRPGENFKVLLKGDGGQEVFGYVSFDELAYSYTSLRDAVSTLIRLTQHFEISKEPIVSFDFLERLSSSATSLLEFVEGNASNFRITFNVVKGKLEPRKDTVLLGVIIYQLGDVFLYTLYCAEGQANSNEHGDKEFVVTKPKVTILKKLSSHESDPLLSEELHEMLREFELNYGDRIVIIMES